MRTYSGYGVPLKEYNLTNSLDQTYIFIDGDTCDQF